MWPLEKNNCPPLRYMLLVLQIWTLVWENSHCTLYYELQCDFTRLAFLCDKCEIHFWPCSNQFIHVDTINVCEYWKCFKYKKKKSSKSSCYTRHTDHLCCEKYYKHYSPNYNSFFLYSVALSCTDRNPQLWSFQTCIKVSVILNYMLQFTVQTVLITQAFNTNVIVHSATLVTKQGWVTVY